MPCNLRQPFHLFSNYLLPCAEYATRKKKERKKEREKERKKERKREREKERRKEREKERKIDSARC